ncbi:MAG: bifunctional UDP-N-acetylglucosamine diphosphorylase/glucosamine-1-phosphate N-acetyltransferase GlmU [Paracoccaceae bacterium]
MPTALIVLAAGQGTRMNSDLPKVLHSLAGYPLFAHALQAAHALDAEKTVIVVGHGGDAVKAAALEIDPDVIVVEQTEQLGTAHAAAQAKDALAGFDGDVFILFGDTPFLRAQTLEKMATARTDFDIAVLGFQAADPGRYGRLIMQGDRLEKIVEFKDANAQEKAVTLCNGGIMTGTAAAMFDLIAQIDNANASDEYYLTDLVGLANGKGLKCTAVQCEEAETMGINTRAQLADAEVQFQTNARAAALENGVTMTAADTVFFALDTHLGRDVIIEPNVVFGPGVTVETGATIRAFSHLEGCHVSKGAIVGPYARLRPGAEIGNDARVGNFVEIKNTELGEGAKVGHLTYLGDAHIGNKTNIGAGTVTCNYDGVMKHKTVIGKNAFIGSNTMLIAPVTVGDDALTASGSVITNDVPEGALALGRAKQVNKPGLARKLFEKLKSAAKKQKEGA